MELTGGEIVVKKIIKEGVKYILGIPGHGVLGLFDAVRKEEESGNIKYIQVKHEQAAAAIADGYYRISLKPLAVFASIGPGSLNLSIGLGTAFVDSIPFLALCGDTHVHMKGVGVLQEIERQQDGNNIKSLRPLSKRSWRAESVNQLPRIMDNAFREMNLGRKGPCVVMLPMDVQSESINIDDSIAAQGYIEHLPKAEGSVIKKAIEVMKTAKRPVILAGGGALYSRAGHLIEQLAKKWGAAIVTTLAAKGTVSEENQQYCFHTGSKGTPIGIKICKQADVILALGTRFADETTCSYRKGASFNFPDTKLIHIDIDPHELGKNYAPDIGIISDAGLAVAEILQSNENFNINEAYLQEIKELRADWFKYLQTSRQKQGDTMTISKVVGILNEVLPDDTIISTSSGNTQAQLFQEYCYKKPYCNLTTGGFSAMGWAIPAAIGAKLAAPDRPVVAFLGDGDFMMVMQELSTLAQYNIPVIVVLADNRGWMAIKDLQNDAFGEGYTFGNDFEADGKAYSPDFASIAKAFKIKAYRVSDPDEVKLALSDALKLQAPALIHIDVSNKYPDSGGKSFGWWDVPIPAYIENKRADYIAKAKGEKV